MVEAKPKVKIPMKASLNKAISTEKALISGLLTAINTKATG
jgi:hypothetical protein